MLLGKPDASTARPPISRGHPSMLLLGPTTPSTRGIVPFCRSLSALLTKGWRLREASVTGERTRRTLEVSFSNSPGLNPTLQMGKLRPRAGESFVPGQTAGERPARSWSRGSLTLTLPASHPRFVLLSGQQAQN